MLCITIRFFLEELLSSGHTSCPPKMLRRLKMRMMLQSAAPAAVHLAQVPALTPASCWSLVGGREVGYTQSATERQDCTAWSSSSTNVFPIASANQDPALLHTGCSSKCHFPCFKFHSRGKSQPRMLQQMFVPLRISKAVGLQAM